MPLPPPPAPAPIAIAPPPQSPQAPATQAPATQREAHAPGALADAAKPAAGARPLAKRAEPARPAAFGDLVASTALPESERQALRRLDAAVGDRWQRLAAPAPALADLQRRWPVAGGSAGLRFDAEGVHWVEPDGSHWFAPLDGALLQRLRQLF